MGIDPLAMIQAQRAAPPTIEGARVVDGPVFNDNGRPNLHSLPQGPGSPGYLARIPPGEKISGDQEEPNAADDELDALIKEMGTMSEGSPKGKRIVVMFGRREGTYTVVVETPPDWDVVDSAIVSEQSLVEMLPVLRALGKIKDTTAGELLAAEEDYHEKSARSKSTPGASKGAANARAGQSEAKAARTDGDGEAV